MNNGERFQEYRRLLQALEQKSQSLMQLHQTQMQCRKGCHSCCQPALSVSLIEAEHIKAWLDEHPMQREKIEALQKENPWANTRCSLLDNTGGCSIYPVRPVICRSHGFPIRLQDAGKPTTDSCPLNFSEIDLDCLEDSSCIDLDRLNALLAAIAIRYAGKAAGQRRGLNLTGLTESDPIEPILD